MGHKHFGSLIWRKATTGVGLQPELNANATSGIPRWELRGNVQPDGLAYAGAMRL